MKKKTSPIKQFLVSQLMDEIEKWDAKKIKEYAQKKWKEELEKSSLRKIQLMGIEFGIFEETEVETEKKEEKDKKEKPKK